MSLLSRRWPPAPRGSSTGGEKGDSLGPAKPLDGFLQVSSREERRKDLTEETVWSGEGRQRCGVRRRCQERGPGRGRLTGHWSGF
jgi:hypothetical protein